MPDQESKKDNDRTSGIEKAVQSVVIGAPRAIITFGAGHPFDLVKTRMQANPQIQSAVLLSNEIFKKTGIKGFYVGGLANGTRHVIKNAYRDPIRGFSKAFYKAKFPDASEASIGAATSLTMSTTDTYIIAPLERMKVWLMTNRSEDKSISKFFVNKPKGLSPSFEYFYRGAHISWMRSTISWGTYLIPEAIIREQVIKLSPRVTEKNSKIPHIPLPEQIFIGAAGGIINALCMLPFDAVKTNIQKPEYTGRATIKNMLRVGKNLVADHGIKGLYSGFWPRLIHYSIVGVLTEGVMQQVDQVWADHFQHQKR
jgi:Mitochondrial carrier protein